MASHTRLRRAIAPLLEQQPFQRQLQHGLSPRTQRTFTTTPRCLARPGRGNSFVPSMPSMKHPPQKSMNVAIQEQKEMAAMPDDIGFLPGTFIMPTGRALPSFTSNFSGRWKLEKARLMQRAKDELATTVIKLFYTRDRTRRHPISRIHKRFRKTFQFPHLQRAQIPGIAKTLYEDMYANFAKGSVDALRSKLCENVFESLRARVMARPANTSLRWTLHKYIGKPKVVSHRFTPLSSGVKDKYKQSVLQQAVVRIKSMQSLQRLKKVRGADGKVREVLEEGSAGEDKEGKEVTELFVVQRMMRKGTWGEWKVWGTTEEMTLEKLELEEKKRVGLA